jgi:hypothetical protein
MSLEQFIDAIYETRQVINAHRGPYGDPRAGSDDFAEWDEHGADVDQFWLNIAHFKFPGITRFKEKYKTTFFGRFDFIELLVGCIHSIRVHAYAKMIKTKKIVWNVCIEDDGAAGGETIKGSVAQIENTGPPSISSDVLL